MQEKKTVPKLSQMVEKNKFEKMNKNSQWVIVSSLSTLVDVLRFKILTLKKETTKLKKHVMELTNESNSTN